VVEPINLEKKPPALAGCTWVGATLVETVAAEDDEEIDTRDGLCARLLGRDGDEGALSSFGTGS
jgi:hypothetical protein